jgi:hypothetical protein
MNNIDTICRLCYVHIFGQVFNYGAVLAVQSYSGIKLNKSQIIVIDNVIITIVIL